MSTKLSELVETFADYPDEKVMSAVTLGMLREAVSALQLADRLCKEALPKFNWAASALDANAIDLLNRAPAAIEKVIESDPLDDAIGQAGGRFTI